MPIINGTWTAWELLNSTNSTNLLKIAEYNNSIMNDMFGTLLLLSLLVIFIMITSSTRSNISIQISLFITSIIGFLLAAIGLVGVHIPVTIMIAFVGSMVLLYRGGN